MAQESRGYLSAAAVAFVIAVGTLAAGEILFLHTAPGLRAATLRVLYWGPYVPYVGWSARINVATLHLLLSRKDKSTPPRGKPPKRSPNTILTIGIGVAL